MARRTAGRRAKSGKTWHLVAIICVAILAYFLFSLSGLVVSRHNLEDRLAIVQSEVTALKAESKVLEREVAWLESDEALESLAREELGWVKSGETGVIVSRPTTVAAGGVDAARAPESLPAGEPNWERWWGLFFGD